MAHPVRVGIGGWNFEPWEETFYPPKLAKKKQLEYAASKLTAIEINGTFYRNQTPATYKKWAGETPPGFMFTVKAHRYTVTRKPADEMKDSVKWFLDSGVAELGDRLGPINWQFNNKKFDRAYFAAFLGALPKEHARMKLRHALEVRHKSFEDPAFHDLLRDHGAALVSADDDEWPQADVATADFAYARLQRTRADEKTGYPARELNAWAKTFQKWSEKRDVFAFFISGAKETNPAAAMALIAKL